MTTRHMHFAATFLASIAISWPLIGQAAVSGYANGQFYSVPPNLEQSIPPNVLLNLSVETPMGGAAYNDQKDTETGCTGRENLSGNDTQQPPAKAGGLKLRTESPDTGR
ncbi:hypothetical protein, partial [Thiorhodococcus fuscus]